MHEADKLLDLFRHRQHYFPFVAVPEAASASFMAVRRPFLFLAILNVCSSRAPIVQQRTNERFRRVLSERIIYHGEKSVDYLQGLLVYIAWWVSILHTQSDDLEFLKLTIKIQVPISL